MHAAPDHSETPAPLPPFVAPRVSPRSALGHRARELALWLERLRAPRRHKSILLFPSSWAAEGSTRLRAVEVAKHLRTLGWRALCVPAQLELSQRRRILRAERPALVVFQKARHPLNRADLYDNLPPLVFDLDDADYCDPQQAQRCAHLARAAVLCLAGSETVAQWLRPHAQRVEVLWTGAPEPTHVPARLRDASLPIAPTSAPATPPVIAWGQSDSTRYPREGEMLVRILLALARHEPRVPFTLRLYGVRDSAVANAWAAPLRDAGVRVELIPMLPPREFEASLADVAAGLHLVAPGSDFASGKSFGKVLSYLTTGVPVVCSAVGENPHFFEHNRTGMLCAGEDDFVRALRDVLADAARARTMALAAWEEYRARLSTRAVATRADALLTSLLASQEAR